MKAKIRFVTQPTFNYPPNRLMVPGILIGRATERRMWTMTFTVTQQVSTLVYVGELQWLANPIEQDFGSGVKFHLISNPKLYVDGPSPMGVLAMGELL